SSIATTGAGAIVDQILGITATRGVSLVGDGPLTASTVQLLSGRGPTLAIGAANLVGPGENASGTAGSADLAPVRYTP
ncbi:hypothetical protein C6A85_06450, partial [Mycobacterium sp. ITM-2017-0098]